MPRQRNAFIPQSLLTVYTSTSGMTDLRTGLPYRSGGGMRGISLDLTEDEAQAQSSNLHTGTYRYVQIDTSATAANIKRGSVGLMLSTASGNGINKVTSFDAGLTTGARPVIFLATVTAAQVTAGAYVWAQEGGIASLQAKGSATGSKGDLVVAATGDAGLVTSPTQSGSPTFATAKTIIGQALADFTDAATFLAELRLPVELG